MKTTIKKLNNSLKTFRIVNTFQSIHRLMHLDSRISSSAHETQYDLMTKNKPVVTQQYIYTKYVERIEVKYNFWDYTLDFFELTFANFKKWNLTLPEYTRYTVFESSKKKKTFTFVEKTPLNLILLQNLSWLIKKKNICLYFHFLLICLSTYLAVFLVYFVILQLMLYYINIISVISFIYFYLYLIFFLFFILFFLRMSKNANTTSKLATNYNLSVLAVFIVCLIYYLKNIIFYNQNKMLITNFIVTEPHNVTNNIEPLFNSIITLLNNHIFFYPTPIDFSYKHCIVGIIDLIFVTQQFYSTNFDTYLLELVFVVFIISMVVLITKRIIDRFFLVLSCLIFGALTAAFMTNNILHFYIYFESVLIPMFIIIGGWGSRERKINASYYLFFYTMIGSFFLLFGIMYLYIVFNTYDITIFSLINITSFTEQHFLFFCFFIPFAIKIPMFPFHIWLLEAHVEAPTLGSIILASLLLKLGSYGLLKFTKPLCENVIPMYMNIIAVICLIGLIFSSFCAIRQNDLKRIIAYSSIAHMNLIVLSICLDFQTTTASIEGLSGGKFLMLAHGFVSAGLFFLVGIIYSRLKTRSLRKISGLVSYTPMLIMCFFFFILANFGFPGTMNFSAEFLIFIGLLENNLFVATCASIGILLSACYSILMFNKISFGTIMKLFKDNDVTTDINKAEFGVIFLLILSVIIFGFFGAFYLEYIEVEYLFNNNYKENFKKNMLWSLNLPNYEMILELKDTLENTDTFTTKDFHTFFYHYVAVWGPRQWFLSVLGLIVTYRITTTLYNNFVYRFSLTSAGWISSASRSGLLVLDFCINVIVGILILIYLTPGSKLFILVCKCPIAFSPIFIFIEAFCVAIYTYCSKKKNNFYNQQICLPILTNLRKTTSCSKLPFNPNSLVLLPFDIQKKMEFIMNFHWNSIKKNTHSIEDLFYKEFGESMETFSEKITEHITFLENTAAKIKKKNKFNADQDFCTNIDLNWTETDQINYQKYNENSNIFELEYVYTSMKVCYIMLIFINNSFIRKWPHLDSIFVVCYYYRYNYFLGKFCYNFLKQVFVDNLDPHFYYPHITKIFAEAQKIVTDANYKKLLFGWSSFDSLFLDFIKEDVSFLKLKTGSSLLNLFEEFINFYPKYQNNYNDITYRITIIEQMQKTYKNIALNNQYFTRRCLETSSNFFINNWLDLFVQTCRKWIRYLIENLKIIIINFIWLIIKNIINLITYLIRTLRIKEISIEMFIIIKQIIKRDPIVWRDFNTCIYILKDKIFTDSHWISINWKLFKKNIKLKVTNPGETFKNWLKSFFK